VLFVGLGVDFGIQFSVRYRSERHEQAMLAILRPPGELASVGFRSLAPLDDFWQRHRIAVIAGTIGVVLAGTPLLLRLPFDFNPVNLENPNAPSVRAYHELVRNSETSGNDIEVLATSLNEADATAQRLSKLPEVSRTLTLNSFVPGDQDLKIIAIRTALPRLTIALDRPRQPAPSDRDTVEAIRKTATDLAKVAGNASGPGAEVARHVSDLLMRLAESDAGTRGKVEIATVSPLNYDLGWLRSGLDPQPVSIKTLPSNLIQDWVLPDGRARVQVLPKGDSNDDDVLRKFATAVLVAEPLATGPAISLYESGRTVISAFIEAGMIALAAIAVLLFIALRRVADVLLTLIPLLLAGAVTLEICVLTGTAINFANIIALPLLLGVGVAFKIYYVMAWRDGKTGLLQSSLTRAVIFSAMTNAVAFGSMWSSDYPGMSSMGKMMALALLCTMAAAVLFQPVLMGRPRQLREVALPAPKLVADPAE
jgi:hopanoid biosynthesis associated RND transporter like protein HpnN